MASVEKLPEPDGSLAYEPDHPVDFAMCPMWVKTITRRKGIHWWGTNTPTGPAITAFRAAGGSVRADSWGPGTDWALTRLPSLLGQDDDPSDFRPLSPEVEAIAARFPNPRVGATGRWYEALATLAIGQRVVRADAQRSRTQLARRFGTVIPGGDPDAVPLGDLHLPRMVTYALSGREGDDNRMLELLEPYRGHRMRVIRMVKPAGVGPARRRPQPSRHDISRI